MTPSGRQQVIGVLSLTSVLWLTLLAARSPNGGIDVLARTGYWIMLGLIAAWIRAAYVALPRLPWRQLVLPVAAAAVGTAVCFASTPIGFKVLSDETNLLSVSQSMYQDRTALHPTMGKFYYENFHATFVSAPTRPLVFPFLLSVLHGLFGYHAWNAFVLNAVALFALLFLVMLTVQRRLGPWDALAAALLILSQPIVLICATSGGFDLLSALFLCGVLVSAAHHIHERTADSLVLVWMTLLVYAQVRYESIIAAPLVMGFLAARGYIATSMVQSRFAWFAAGPLLLFPWLLQRHINRSSFENPPGVPAFSIVHFRNHLQELASVQFDFEFYFPYNNVLNLASCLLLATLLYVWVRSRSMREQREAGDLIVLTILTVGSSLTVFLCHHMGQAGHPAQARFFLPLSIALAVVPLVARRFRPDWFSAGTLLACSTALFLIYQPVAGESRIMRTLLLTRQTNLAMEYLARIGHRRVLTISDRSGQYAALGVGAVDFPTARKEADVLLREHRQRLFDEIIVFQEIEFATDEPLELQRLPASFPLKTAAEYQIDGDRKWRISRAIRRDDGL